MDNEQSKQFKAESFLFLGFHTDDNERFANMAAKKIMEMVDPDLESTIIMVREGIEGVERKDYSRLVELIKDGLNPTEAHLHLFAEKMLEIFKSEYQHTTNVIPDFNWFIDIAKDKFHKDQSEFVKLNLKAIDSIYEALRGNKNIELHYLPEIVEDSDQYQNRRDQRGRIEYYIKQINAQLKDRNISDAIVYLKRGLSAFAAMNRERELSLTKEIISAVESSKKGNIKIFITFGQSHSYLSQSLRLMSNDTINTHNIYEERQQNGKIYASASDSLIRKLMIDPNVGISDSIYLKVLILDHVESTVQELNRYSIQDIARSVHEVSRSEMFQDKTIDGSILPADEHATSIFLENLNNPMDILIRFSPHFKSIHN